VTVYCDALSWWKCQLVSTAEMPSIFYFLCKVFLGLLGMYRIHPYGWPRWLVLLLLLALYFCGTRDHTQGLEHARQGLYHLSHAPQTFCSAFCFWDKVLLTASDILKLMTILSLPPKKLGLRMCTTHAWLTSGLLHLLHTFISYKSILFWLNNKHLEKFEIY
jgi:hypothetical protein